MSKKDYMGVMVVNHYVSESPLSCFGTQVPVKAITEIAIHEGGYDEEGRIVKGKTLTKLRMSDLQFGKIVARPNSSGHDCTLEYLNGFAVNSEHIEQDPARTKLADAIEKSGNKDTQISRFISEISVLIKESNVKKRIVQKKELLHRFKLIQVNSTSNFKHHVEEVGRVGMSRVLEAKSQIHNIIRNSYRLSTTPLRLENLTNDKGDFELSCLAKAAIYNSSGRVDLFDTVGDSSDFVTFNLYAESSSHVQKEIDKVNSKSDDGLKDHIFISNEVARVYMSLEQYARFVRADATEVPCTINKVGKLKPNDDFDKDPRELLWGDLDAESNHVLGDMIFLARQAEGLLMTTGCKSAKDRMILTDLFEQIKSAFDESEEGSLRVSKKSSESVMKGYQLEIDKYSKDELSLLPEDIAERIRPLLSLKNKED
jgi:hypothetical protein